MSRAPRATPAPFVVTGEYRRFVEFCDACLRYRYIGLCYGTPGVGKTLSARHYAQWDEVGRFLGLRPEMPLGPYLSHLGTVTDGVLPPRALGACQTVFVTVDVSHTPHAVAQQIASLRDAVNWTVAGATRTRGDALWPSQLPDRVGLIVVDEADRLRLTGLERLREIYDRGGVGLVLLGMPGIERRLARFPQLYSRVGFVHHFRALDPQEARRVVIEEAAQLGVGLGPADFADPEAVAAIVRVTGGNFRLLQRLLAQVERIMEINGLETVTKAAVDAARDSLVIGAA